MRSLITLVLIVLFVVGFVAFFFADSILRYANDGDALLATAHKAKLRAGLVDIGTEYVAAELKRDPRVEDVDLTSLHALLEDVVTDAWCDESLRTIHQALADAIERSDKTAIVDLRETKTKIKAALVELEKGALAKCTRVFGLTFCENESTARQLVAAFRQRAAKAVDRVDDKFDFIGGVRGHGGHTTKLLRQVRERLGYLAAVRWAGLAVLLLTLALVAFMNSDAAPLAAVGLALLLAAAAYLGTRHLLHSELSARVEQEVAARLGHPRTPVDQAMATTSQRFVVELARDATLRSNATVWFLGGLGGVLVLVGLVGRRQKPRAEHLA